MTWRPSWRCARGNGIAQTIELGLAPMLASGALVQVLPDWAEERFPLYAYYPSRHLAPAKVRAFVDFVVESVASQRMCADWQRLGAT